MMTNATANLELNDIQFRPISKDLAVRGFTCGDPGIDRYINRKCLKHHDLRRVRAVCAVRRGSTSVLGAYALTTSLEETSKLLGDARHYAVHEFFPAVYIQSFAVVKRCQNLGLGSFMLMNALRRSYSIANNTAIYGVALRSLNAETERFYGKFGFKRIDDNPNPLMVLPVWTLCDLIEQKI